jgi:NurA domain
MLFRELLTDELNKQREEFTLFAQSQAGDLDYYVNKLARFAEKSYYDISGILNDCADCGAMPSEEVSLVNDFSLDFRERWENHEEARRWAFEILKNRTTFAADGSQIVLDREISFRVGGVQIGWFENPHNPEKGYKKNAEFTIISPQDFISEAQTGRAESYVGERRFTAEIEKVKEFIHEKRDWQANGEPLPLAFYDGTLLLSVTEFQRNITAQLVELARLSRDCKVPVIGYVDRSYACDLMTMLDSYEGEKAELLRSLDDVSILHAATLKNWGDRTPFCYSRRDGLDAFIDPRTDESLVGFVYLQTTSDNPPARLDIPSWIYKDGLLDEIVDIVRAECVIGLGYPYPLETADQTAVITVKDREIFLRALQDFAVREKLAFSVSRKSASKGRRR